MEKLKIVTPILLSILIILILLDKCNSPEVLTKETHRIDTIWHDTTIVIMQQPIYVNPPIPKAIVKDSVTRDSLIKNNISFCDTFHREYVVPYEDSLIQMVINPTTKGELLTLPFEYKIKDQKISYPTITETITKYKPNRGLYIGLDIINYPQSFTRRLDLSPNVSLVYDKNIIKLGASPLTQSITIGYSRRIL